MSRARNSDLINKIQEFYRAHYDGEIEQLFKRYPTEQRSLYIDYERLERFDDELADDFRDQPAQMREYFEEALRLYDHTNDASLGRAHVRAENLPGNVSIRGIRVHDDQIGKLIPITGYVREASDVNPKLTEGAFECQRCGTMTYIPQPGHETQEPTECQGCDRQSPFRTNLDQSEFIDHQQVILQDDPKHLNEGETPRQIEVDLRDDIAGSISAGNAVRINGILHLTQARDEEDLQKSFDLHMDAMSIEDRHSNNPVGELPPGAIDLETFAKLASNALVGLDGVTREEETKAKLVTPFISALGWNKFDSTEVRLEYSDEKTSLRPDYALFGTGSESPNIIVEAKQLDTELHHKEDQLHDYLRVFAAEWGILTNGVEFFIYHRDENTGIPTKVTELTLNDIPQADILDSLKRDAFGG